MVVKIKPWPKVGTVSFSELADPICKAIRFSHKLTRRNVNKDIPYEGYERESILASNLSIEETLSVKQMQYNSQDQGRPALEVLVGIAIQLGIEQGYRIAEREYEGTINIYKELLKETRVDSLEGSHLFKDRS